MNHLQVSGEHWDIGFQWGSLLAQRGILIWERIPFPLTPERKAFGSVSLSPSPRRGKPLPSGAGPSTRRFYIAKSPAFPSRNP